MSPIFKIADYMSTVYSMPLSHYLESENPRISLDHQAGLFVLRNHKFSGRGRLNDTPITDDIMGCLRSHPLASFVTSLINYLGLFKLST
jgi:hypothetical protein